MVYRVEANEFQLAEALLDSGRLTPDEAQATSVSRARRGENLKLQEQLLASQDKVFALQKTLLTLRALVNEQPQMNE